MKVSKKLFSIVLLMILSISAHASCVILLHGLARTSASMGKLEKHLTEEGFRVVNLGYPSRDDVIENLARQAIYPSLAECHPEQAVNFVTHSLGGILIRQYLSAHEIPNLNRVVMLGPPNKGSEVVDKMGEVPGFNLINGKAGMQLSTDSNSVPNTLGRAEFDVGIIAGTKSINLILSYLIPGRDDGKVSVESTKLLGMNDHIVLPVTHTFMMSNKNVIAQTIYYLRNGKFKKE
ncbi:MAG: alpha/beta hydrolase [Gammaproteobacteria bacterium]|nr:alpha/beta hydrolase [Gammaproteobacteria bacterium]